MRELILQRIRDYFIDYEIDLNDEKHPRYVSFEDMELMSDEELLNYYENLFLP